MHGYNLLWLLLMYYLFQMYSIWSFLVEEIFGFNEYITDLIH